MVKTIWVEIVVKTSHLLGFFFSYISTLKFINGLDTNYITLFVTNIRYKSLLPTIPKLFVQF
jgi:hypothetical protein